jgi:hypothetical protein
MHSLKTTYFIWFNDQGAFTANVIWILLSIFHRQWRVWPDINIVSPVWWNKMPVEHAP